METHKHEFKETYYGWKCECGLFYQYGGAPWEEPEDEWLVLDEENEELNELEQHQRAVGETNGE